MPATFEFDPAQSRFTVQAFATGLFSLFGHNPTFAIRDFTGALGFDPATPADSWLRMSVNVSSLQLLDQVSARDREEIEGRMRGEVLETDRYPEVHFESTGVTVTPAAEGRYRLGITGRLSLHGVVNPHRVDAMLALGDGWVRFGGEFSLSQSAYHIRQVTALGGAIRLKDELKCSFNIAGLKQEIQ